MAGGTEATLLLRIKQAGQEILDRLVITFGDLRQLAADVAEAIAATVRAFREQEEAVQSLNQSMINAGTYTGELQREYLDMATALQQVTKFGDEQIVSAQALLQAHIGNRKVTQELVEATLDLATAKKMDLSSAADLIGKAIATESNVLQRHGIVLDESIAKHDRMAAVIAAVSDKHGDQARAAAQGLGSIDRLKNAFSDFLENVGEKLAPTISHYTEKLITMFNVINGWVGGNTLARKSVKELGDELSTLKQKLTELEATPKIQLQKKLGMSIPEMDVLRTKITETTAMYEQAMSDEIAATANAEQQKQSIKLQKHQETAMLLAEQENAQLELKNALVAATEEQELTRQIAHLDKQIKNAEDHQTKLTLTQQKGNLLRQQNTVLTQKAEQDLALKHQKAQVDVFVGAMNLIAAAADSGSKAAFLAQKAAAIAQTIVSTNMAAAMALATPPAPNFALAGLARAAGALNLGAILATTVKGLADGGIVKAQPGGAPFIIGEGGRDEAVIPLDSPEAADRLGGRGETHVHFHGPIMGDASQAREFARAIDRELYYLRKDGESQSFDGRLS